MSISTRFGIKWSRPQYANTNEEYWPTRWNAWRRLCNLVPDLDRMRHVRNLNQVPPPRPMTDAAFLAFAACFADPVKREALRTLVFDLLADDLKEIIKASKGG